MKVLLTAVILLVAPLLQASPYTCASMGHAEDAVQSRLNVDPADGSIQALWGHDEYEGGGQYVYRKIVVRVSDAHSAHYEDMIVSYSIVKSFDGPDHGDYCSLTAVQFKSDVCSARPNLVVCK